MTVSHRITVVQLPFELEPSDSDSGVAFMNLFVSVITWSRIEAMCNFLLVLTSCLSQTTCYGL